MSIYNLPLKPLSGFELGSKASDALESFYYNNISTSSKAQSVVSRFIAPTVTFGLPFMSQSLEFMNLPNRSWMCLWYNGINAASHTAAGVYNFVKGINGSQDSKAAAIDHFKSAGKFAVRAAADAAVSFIPVEYVPVAMLAELVINVAAPVLARTKVADAFGLVDKAIGKSHYFKPLTSSTVDDVHAAFNAQELYLARYNSDDELVLADENELADATYEITDGR